MMVRTAKTAGCAWRLALGAMTWLAGNPSRAGESFEALAYSSRMPLPLHVTGIRLLNSRNESVILRGVNTPSLEWTNNGEGHILQTVNTAIRDWHVNVIRLPLSQDRWFGKAPEQQDDGVAYRKLVRDIVDTCATQGCYIVLDLQWSDCGEWGANIGMHSMPDRNSITFWQDCAATFKDHPAVLFDLYNEPHDVSWNVWLNGGTVKDRPNTRRGGPAKTFEAVGLQTLLETVRGTGARNVVVAGGLDWAYDFSGILEGIQLFDQRGNGVLYANHAYNNKGDSAAEWIAKMKKAAARLPVIVSEFGGSGGPHRRAPRPGQPAIPGGDDWFLHVLQALQDNHWSWIAWDLHPFAGPNLISDWNYTPTPDFGVYIKQALAGKLPRYTPPASVRPADGRTHPAPKGGSPTSR
jgi:endoglucanase